MQLQAWWGEPDSSVLLTHFWLSELTDEKRLQLLDMEFSLLMEEIKLAFRGGMDRYVVADFLEGQPVCP